MTDMTDPIETPELQPGKPCPLCGKPSMQKYRPFCGKRCADVDLNRWLSGVYAVPVETDEDEDGTPGTDPDRPE